MSVRSRVHRQRLESSRGKERIETSLLCLKPQRSLVHSVPHTFIMPPLTPAVLTISMEE